MVSVSQYNSGIDLLTIIMADEEKRKRKQTKSNFTRNANTLDRLLDDVAMPELVKPQFETVKSCWQSLENAHDDYIAKAGDVEDNVDGLLYLVEPGERHTAILLKYSTYLKGQVEVEKVSTERKLEADRLLEEERQKRETREMKEAEDARKNEELTKRFESMKLEVEADVDTFKRVTRGLRDSLKDASDRDKRNQWEKVESEFKLVKAKYIELVSMDASKNVEDVHQKFSADVETLFIETQEWMLSQLKDSSATSGGSTRSSSSSSTKKEAVKLPRFEGDEKMSPFLKFPTWKNQWDKMIEDYDEKWRSGLLFEHLDDTARSKFIGYETDYEESIKRLNLFYGDKLKVVTSVMKEVNVPRSIAEGDYKGLLKHSVILESNFNRLKNIGFEHEISNIQSMTSILKRFPRGVAEKWNDVLTLKTPDEKAKPFPVFVEWLMSRRETWERMSAADPGKKDSSGSKGGGASAFLGDAEQRVKPCHGCGSTDHLVADCTNKKNQRNWKAKNTRRSPNVKKFWCALHKGDQKRRCSSDNCMELKKLHPSERVKLLDENGDCHHCVGGHKSADCLKKDRVCGGRKEDRGCTKSHNVHELFCLSAKVFIGSTVLSVDADSDSTGVVLLIMQVQCLRRGVRANTLWDSGCTSNFVREEFAKSCGFKGKEADLSVTTLGSVITDITVITYTCFLRDVNGKVESFEAYGMETITGKLSKIGSWRIKKLFPHLSDDTVQMLTRGDRVDVLIGISHPSWHPERAEKAKGGGDFWIYRGRFGSCLGGRYPGIKEGTQKSSNLFHVNQTYHITCTVKPKGSHELEFCPKRVESYYAAEVSSPRSVSKEVQLSNDPVSSQHDVVEVSTVDQLSDTEGSTVNQHVVEVSTVDQFSDAEGPTVNQHDVEVSNVDQFSDAERSTIDQLHDAEGSNVDQSHDSEVLILDQLHDAEGLTIDQVHVAEDSSVECL